MRIFITGGSGFVGGALVRRLVAAGHGVIALSRSKATGERLRELGAEPWPGDLANADAVRGAAAAADAAVHAAIDYADPGFGELDRRAVQALLGARGARTVYMSSTLVYGHTGGEAATEARKPAPLVQPFKVDGERMVLAAGGTVVRPGLVYGYDGSGLLDGMSASARENGVVHYVGTGANRWSVVHADDLAELVCIGLERPIGAAVLNAAAGSAPSMREIAEAIAASEDATAASLAVGEAAAAMGDFADQLTRDLVVDASRARELLGWNSERPGLLDTLTSRDALSA